MTKKRDVTKLTNRELGKEITRIDAIRITKNNRALWIYEKALKDERDRRIIEIFGSL